jgi:hypothetical protein
MYKNIPITPAYENLTDAALLRDFLQKATSQEGYVSWGIGIAWGPV